MKAVPFINTMLNEQYRVYVLQEFDHKILTDLFTGWKYKDMVGWGKLTDGDSITIEFHVDYYKITTGNSNSTSFPYPKNLDQFICDCHRCSVNLHWQESIVESMNRPYFIDQSKIEDYNKELLTKIDKS